ncbi:MAG: hypothetical protein IPK53_09915 [bacterium]|nr:hypothetical protein [bacterium]
MSVSLALLLLPGRLWRRRGGSGRFEPEAPAESEDVSEAPAADACGSVELQYWNPFTGPDGPLMGEMVEAFNAEHENINVVMTTQSEYYTQLGTAAASNTLPDVAIVHADQVATQAFRKHPAPH